MTAINDLESRLAAVGLSNAAADLAEEIQRGTVAVHLAHAASGDLAHLGMSGLAYKSLADAEAKRVATDHARHALVVLAGGYDDAVRSGQPTLTENGVMPPLVEQAHQRRRHILGI